MDYKWFAVCKKCGGQIPVSFDDLGKDGIVIVVFPFTWDFLCPGCGTPTLDKESISSNYTFTPMRKVSDEVWYKPWTWGEYHWEANHA